MAELVLPGIEEVEQHAVHGEYGTAHQLPQVSQSTVPVTAMALTRLSGRRYSPMRNVLLNSSMPGGAALHWTRRLWRAGHR